MNCFSWIKVFPTIKVNFFNRIVISNFLKIISWISTFVSFFVLFADIPQKYKETGGYLFLTLLVGIYICIWIRSNSLKTVNIKVEETHVTVTTGDIFQQDGLKAIAFNEYFDTQVDDKIISRESLNGIFIEKYLKEDVSNLNSYIDSYSFGDDAKLEFNSNRNNGKKQKFRLGTVCLYNDFLLTALSKFDERNKANLTMPEFLEFLISFWDNVNTVYSQKSVFTPIFGSGITRIKGHKNISDEDLLKIMLWTFRISEMRFKFPAKLTIIIHESKIDSINLLDIKSTRNGI